MKYMLFVISLITTFIAGAQQLEIETQAELLPKSIYAARNTRQTPKGKFCGVLMVHSIVKDLRFEGATVGPVAYQDGIYYVYLAPETSKLKVANAVGNTINLVLPKIQSKATYQVTIFESEVRGSLVCQSDPSGAQVTLLTPDGEIDLGRTPLRGNIDILEGTYSIRVTKPGYKDKTIKNVKIRNGKKNSLGTIKLSQL